MEFLRRVVFRQLAEDFRSRQPTQSTLVFQERARLSLGLVGGGQNIVSLHGRQIVRELFLCRHCLLHPTRNDDPQMSILRAS